VPSIPRRCASPLLTLPHSKLTQSVFQSHRPRRMNYTSTARERRNRCTNKRLHPSHEISHVPALTSSDRENVLPALGLRDIANTFSAGRTGLGKIRDTFPCRLVRRNVSQEILCYQPSLRDQSPVFRNQKLDSNMCCFHTLSACI